MSELKPCPFCGGEAIVVKTERCGRYIECWDCGGRTEEFETDYAGSAHDKAISAWNRRAQHMPTVDTVEVVRCRDCVHFGECLVTENDYCSKGERKESY